ncbi:hypothetical protein [Dyadobacter arcticus]|uniref:Uncharacterized protein n=1 Tax=Dyadobacter arcticus TaxID=1078754 RepID=A0ABX0UL23_9BACT|nr:hypothetical protein [Dyadobacter arcticus]NIJ52375.1 hypothetical protein [Dyadobacter arcticus]
MTALKALLMFIWMICLSGYSHAQDLSPKRKFEAVDRRSSKIMDFEEWVQEGLSNGREKPCEPTFGYFIFIVKNSGEVDSLQYFGTLEKTVSEHILNRIRQSKGGWITKGKADQSKYEWFLYPFFDFGNERYTTSNCSPEEKAKQKLLLEVEANLSMVWVMTMGKNISLINTSKNGGGYIKL